MRGLVTVFGGSGFIGRHVVRALARSGRRVRVVVRNPHVSGALRLAGDPGQIDLRSGNLRNPDSVAAAMEGAEACVNLVGLLQQSGPQSFQKVQAEGPGVLAQAAAAQGVRRFVQISAIGADPHSPSEYARTKAAGEEAARAAIPTAVVLRPSIVFGPEDVFFNRFAQMAVMSPALPLIGGDTRFQPVYVGDVARAVVSALMDERALGQTYELGGPGVYTFRELMEQVLRITGRRRFLAPIPLLAARPLGQAFDLVRKVVPIPAPVTEDQVRLLATDNVVSGVYPGLADLGVTPTSLESILPTYLWRFRKGGQFADPTAGPGLLASERQT